MEEAVAALAVRVQEAKRDGKQIFCSWMFDEIAIMKNIERNGQKFVGFVDAGSGVYEDSAPVTTGALVFMVMSLNSNWKLPCGYFLISRLSGAERANFVNQCF
jgi:hypothetical protein